MISLVCGWLEFVLAVIGLVTNAGTHDAFMARGCESSSEQREDAFSQYTYCTHVRRGSGIESSSGGKAKIEHSSGGVRGQLLMGR